MMGCIVGRFINRVAGASIAAKDGVTIRLVPNNGANAIHGGGTDGGWCMRKWAIGKTTDDSVSFSLDSPAGDQGFPGAIVAAVTYTLLPDGTLRAVLTADSDAETPTNLAPHPYFNLDGASSNTPIRNHTLQLPTAAHKTKVDFKTILPTGAIVPVKGSPFDFSTPTALGARWDSIPVGDFEPGFGGYEAQFLLGGLDGPGSKAAVKDCSLALVTPAAVLSSPTTGRTLTLATNAPALVVYAGTHLDGSVVGKGGTRYAKHAALALEPQDPVDWAHHRDTFSECWLGPGRSLARVWELRPGVDGKKTEREGGVGRARAPSPARSTPWKSH